MTLGVVALLLGGASGAGQSVLDPQGPNAERIATLWWVMFWLGTVVFVIVMALVILAIVRRPAEAQGNRFIIGGGAIIPLAILAVVFGTTLWTMRAMADLDEPDALTVHVIGHQFWWEVQYPDEGVVTANEIRIPVGEPVRFNLVASDVIHSFWVPELGGKQDLIPGKTNTLWLQADAPGEYWGQCAEYCGIQHANMRILIIAQEPEEFAGWVEHERQAAAQPDGGILLQGQEVFLSSACVYCHTVRGTNAAGDVGPDLTHFGSRTTIAAGMLENNTGNLAGWIIDPQAIKPGNQMPGVDLDSEELSALLAYLMSLD